MEGLKNSKSQSLDKRRYCHTRGKVFSKPRKFETRCELLVEVQLSDDYSYYRSYTDFECRLQLPQSKRVSTCGRPIQAKKVQIEMIRALPNARVQIFFNALNNVEIWIFKLFCVCTQRVFTSHS